MNRPHAALLNALAKQGRPGAAAASEAPASSEADSASDSEDAQTLRTLPLSRLLEQQQAASDDENESGAEDAGAVKDQTQRACAKPDAPAAPPVDAEAGASSSGLLPSADDLERIAREEGTFLAVAHPAVQMDPAWKLTPFEQRTAEADAAAADRAALSAGPSMALPSFRYGRGMNALQLGVELSARAAGHVPRELGSEKRGANGRDGDERKRPRRGMGDNDEACTFTT
jgi:hypothetical protein